MGELPERPKFDSVYESVFCTLLLNVNLVLKVVPIEADQYSCTFLSFFYKKIDLFLNFRAFSKNLKLKGKFSENHG